MDKNPNETGSEAVKLDAEGLGKVHGEYRDRLVQSITGFVKDRDKAEDIAAQAFQTAWEERESFRGEALPSTWVQSIARNEARSSLRRERNIQLHSVDQVDARQIPAPQLLTDELEKREDQARLRNALERLPKLYRSALTAHFIEGRSVREIAELLRVPPGTVLSRIFRGKQLLRDALERPGSNRYHLRESPDPPTRDR